MADVVHCRFESEKEGRIGTQHIDIIVAADCLFDETCHFSYLVIGMCVTRKVGQGRTLSQAESTIIVGHCE